MLAGQGGNRPCGLEVSLRPLARTTYIATVWIASSSESSGGSTDPDRQSSTRSFTRLASTEHRTWLSEHSVNPSTMAPQRGSSQRNPLVLHDVVQRACVGTPRRLAGIWPLVAGAMPSNALAFAPESRQNLAMALGHSSG